VPKATQVLDEIVLFRARQEIEDVVIMVDDLEQRLESTIVWKNFSLVS
jgi:hypothetical protein